MTLAALPAPLRWDVPPAGWISDGTAKLAISAAGGTDLFVDPDGAARPAWNAPRLLTYLSGDWTLGARVTATFAAAYDAGVLLLYADHQRWAKLCFERSPQGAPMVVSVVNREVSDDANAFTVDGEQVWLRITRLGTAYAFHASLDGAAWLLVRYFRFDAGTDAGENPDPGPAVGLAAQSPTGTGCTATFHDIRFRPGRHPDLRGGS